MFPKIEEKQSIKEKCLKLIFRYQYYLGITNLIRAAKKPIFTFKLTNGQGEEKKSEEAKKDRYKEEK